MNRKLWNSTGSLALLAGLFIGLVILSGGLLKGCRVDLTENGQYTLSDGTINLLGQLEEPVTLYYFFSEDASRELPQIRDYARWVGEMLDDMEDRAGGKLTVRRVNPEPFSPEEDEAAAFGLQALPVGTGGDSLYLGIAGTNTLDDVQAMPFLQPGKQAFFEYDVIKMITTLSKPEPLTVGLLSGLDMGPGFDMETRQARPAWVIHEQLEQLFEVETIDSGADALPEGIDLLMVVHPKDLSDDMRYAIDQFVLGGGRLVAFVDPFAEADLSGDPNDPMARMNAGGSSTLGELFDAWGVSFETTRVVGDPLYALQVSTGMGQAARHLAILSVPADGLDGGDIVSADLEAVNLASTGWFEAAEGATTTLVPLVRSSDTAAPLDASRLRFLADPSELASGFVSTGDRYTLAARVTGPAASAFEAAPGGSAGQTHRGQAVDEGINVILFADTDMLSDRLWVSRQNFFGQSVTSAFADNGTLAVNAVDNLLGSSDLISIRARSTSARPFDRVERLRLQAENQYRETEERLNAELAETERKLTEMQSQRSGDDLGVLNQAQSDEIQRFMDQRIQIRRDLRAVQHNLDRDIDALGTRLKVINIVVVPVVVIGIALWIGHLRRRRRQEGSA
ncbi:ABC transporter [Marinihelvus fidelis]|uniref:ABC transporter n=1 Tax=Marinihelvus fidelis TaxID=2613842 RepID=A0A5N0T7R8_9GAMM|nr:Gldg family protein [Marinihelvus fidelis]KAA9129866.1 ABC transporter [Marinihelvus fidelis]